MHFLCPKVSLVLTGRFEDWVLDSESSFTKSAGWYWLFSETLICGISMWSRLPLSMMTEFKGRCSRENRGRRLISFSDLDSEIRDHHLYFPTLYCRQFNDLSRNKEKKCRSCLLEKCQNDFLRRICGMIHHGLSLKNSLLWWPIQRGAWRDTVRRLFKDINTYIIKNNKEWKNILTHA